MDVFVCEDGGPSVLLAVRTCVIAGAALLEWAARLHVVVVFLAAQRVLGALPQERGTRPDPRQVVRLADRRDHLLRRVDGVVRVVVLHRHLEVRGPYQAPQVLPTPLVDRPARVQRHQHPIHPALPHVRRLLLNCTRTHNC